MRNISDEERNKIIEAVMAKDRYQTDNEFARETYYVSARITIDTIIEYLNLVNSDK